MGKNRDIEFLVRLLVNTVVHEIVIKHTHKSESKHFFIEAKRWLDTLETFI